MQLHLMVAIAPSRAMYFVIFFFMQAQGLREKAAGLQCRKVAHSAVLKRKDHQVHGTEGPCQWAVIHSCQKCSLLAAQRLKVPPVLTDGAGLCRRSDPQGSKSKAAQSNLNHSVALKNAVRFTVPPQMPSVPLSLWVTLGKWWVFWRLGVPFGILMCLSWVLTSISKDSRCLFAAKWIGVGFVYLILLKKIV